MSRQTWKELISNDFVSAGTLFNTFTTAKTVLPPGALIPFPANYFTLGKKLKLEIEAGISNIVTTPGTFTPSVRFSSTDVSTPGAIQMTTTSNVLIPLSIDIWLEVQVAGTAAQFMSNWRMQALNLNVTGSGAANFIAGTGHAQGPNPPALGTAFDATAVQTMDFFWGFSISQATNGIQIRQYRVYAEN